MDSDADFKVIDLSMLKKHIFFPLSGIGNFTAQTVLYPFVLLRTRLQLQEGSKVYRGLIHAITSVIREEGFRGLYSGYFIRSFHIFSGTIYVSTYEITRHATSIFPTLTPVHRSFIGGAVASCVAQSFFVPIDVISQHLMVINRNRLRLDMVTNTKKLCSNSSEVLIQPAITRNAATTVNNYAMTPIRLTKSEMSSGWNRILGVIQYINKTHSLKGFYKGYTISMCTFVPSSALWWSFYDKFCSLIFILTSKLRPSNIPLSTYSAIDNENEISGNESAHIPRLAIQLISAPLAGISSAILVNPLDCVRVRMQVSHMSFKNSVIYLWSTEGLRWFVKGLSARLIQTTIYSFWLVLVYEPMKIFCLKDDYREKFCDLNTN